MIEYMFETLCLISKKIDSIIRKSQVRILFEVCEIFGSGDAWNMEGMRLWQGQWA